MGVTYLQVKTLTINGQFSVLVKKLKKRKR